MRRKWVLFAMMLSALALVGAGCGGGGESGGSGSGGASGEAKPSGNAAADVASWDDPPGDMIQPKDNTQRPTPDIRKVTARGEKGRLCLSADFSVGPKECFAYTSPKNEKMGNVMMTYLVDNDNNPNSGKAPMWAEDANRPLQGYEYELGVALGFLFTDEFVTKPGRMSGDAVLDLGKQKLHGTFATFGVTRLDAPNPMEKYVQRNPNDRDKTWDDFISIKDNTIDIRIPYEYLNVKAGDTIRICFKEGRFAEGYSEDRKIVLK